MRSANENSVSIPAWVVSFALHGGVVWLAVLFTAQVKPVLVEEIFQWDVSLVEPVKTDSSPEPTPQPAPAPTQQVIPSLQAPRVAARRPVEPMDPGMPTVAPRQTVQLVHPEVQPPKPVDQREDPVPPQKMEQVTPAPEKTIEPLEPQVVEIPKTRPEPVATVKEPEPVQPAEPVNAARQSVAPPPSDVADARPVETPAKPSAAEPLASSSPVDSPPVVSSPPTPGPLEAPLQTAKTAPSGPEVKTDHRWLAESLWRRVAELKRYPSSARLNGQEGKVILKAVIRSDGHLAEVSVQKSSGHHILDAAAMEAVKLACPLHMKHAIGKPEIVVSLPIVYSLAN
jgi:periplasmic protein TonB